MKKLLATFLIVLYSACANSDTELENTYCYKAANCKAGDIIILELTSTIAKLNITKRVVEVCNFDKAIYQHETAMKKLNVACVYIGTKRVKRKK